MPFLPLSNAPTIRVRARGKDRVEERARKEGREGEGKVR